MGIFRRSEILGTSHNALNGKSDISGVFGALSLLAQQGVRRLHVLMRENVWPKKQWAAYLLFVFLFPNQSQAGVSVSIPTALQTDFIATTTAQWNASITTGLFPGDYKITIASKKAGTPPTTPAPVETATALEACLAHGAADGMDIERGANIDTIFGLQAQDALSNRCGGIPVAQLTSTSTIMAACMQTYNIAVSTISLRWGYVFTSTGGIVSK